MLLLLLLLSVAGGQELPTRYRFVFTQVADPTQPHALALGDLALLDADGDHIHIVAASMDGVSKRNEGPDRAIDESTATKFLDLDFLNDRETTLEVDILPNTVVSGYRFTTSPDVPKRDPTSWTLQAFIAGNWAVVHTVTNCVPPPERKTAYPDFWLLSPPPPANASPTYKFTFTQVRGAPNKTVDGVALSGVQLLDASGQDLQVKEVSNPGGVQNVLANAPHNVIDGSKSTNWNDGNFGVENRSELVLTMETSEPAVAYNLWTGDVRSPQKRDPKGWKLEVTLDGQHWQLLSLVRGAAPPWDRSSPYGEGPFRLLFWPPPAPPRPPPSILGTLEDAALGLGLSHAGQGGTASAGVIIAAALGVTVVLFWTCIWCVRTDRCPACASRVAVLSAIVEGIRDGGCLPGWLHRILPSASRTESAACSNGEASTVSKPLCVSDIGMSELGTARAEDPPGGAFHPGIAGGSQIKKKALGRRAKHSRACVGPSEVRSAQGNWLLEEMEKMEAEDGSPATPRPGAYIACAEGGGGTEPEQRRESHRDSEGLQPMLVTAAEQGRQALSEALEANNEVRVVEDDVLNL